jgi:hypothetical protein
LTAIVSESFKDLLHYPASQDYVCQRQPMAKKSKWPDYLLTLAMRFISGGFLGCAAGFLVCFRGILRAFAHNHQHGVLLWLGLWAFIGGIIAACTVPYWERPWYKGIRDKTTLPPPRK